MTNQASEDKLHELLIKEFNTKKRMIEPHDERFVIGFQTEAPGDDVDWQYLDEVIMRYVGDLIRTEKIKLLAEVRERVIGEDLPPDVATDSGIGYSRQQFAINMGKAGQRKALNKLEAEL